MLRCVTLYLKKTAGLYPEKIAFRDAKCSLSYCEVILETEKTAFALTKRNLFKKPVAVMMDKSARNVVALLGVALSGNFYTVIDTKMPQSRIEKILETFQPSLIVVDKRNEKKAEELGYEYVVYEEIIERTD